VLNTAGQVYTEFIVHEDINISVLNKGNVVVKFYNANNELVKAKAKHWSGYLNDQNGNKYGAGVTDKRVIAAGTKLSTVLSPKDLGENTISYVTVTVTNNEGKSMSLTSK
ncbi:MAG: hypothetical protein ACRC5C_04085, partial [Bacilli bacterium]